MAGIGYIRQTTGIQTGERIDASLFNDEYNRLQNAFQYNDSGPTGHTHDGNTGQGGAIAKIGDQNFKNKIEINATDNRIECYIEVGEGNSIEQLRIQDGLIVPVTDSDVDLGTSSVRFKDAFVDSLNASGVVTATGFTIGSAVITEAELEILDGKTFLDEDNMASDSATGIPSQQSVKAYVDAQVTAQDLDITDGSSNIAIDLDSETLSLLGGTGVTSTASGNTVTIAIDTTVATLTGTQTLTNKTLTNPDINGGSIDGTTIGASVVAAGSFSSLSSTLGATFGSSNSSIPALTLTSTDSSAVPMPLLRLQRNSASPADADDIGSLQFYGHDSGSTDTEFSSIIGFMSDVTDGTEDGGISFNIRRNGASTRVARFVGSYLSLDNTTGISASNGISTTFGNIQTSSGDLITSTGDLIATNGVVQTGGANIAKFGSVTDNYSTGTGNTGSTKIVNIGTGYASSTSTTVNIGPTSSSSNTRTINLNGDTNVGSSLDVSSNITVTGTVDGRDIATDGTKLDTIETNADVTNATSVTSAGALMDSELTSEASVKALNQGVATSDSPTFAALTVTGQLSASGISYTNFSTDANGATITGNLTISGTVDGRDVAADGQKLDTIEQDADVTDAANVEAAGAVMINTTNNSQTLFDNINIGNMPSNARNLYVSGTFGVTGTSSFSSNATFYGNINAGNTNCVINAYDTVLTQLGTTDLDAVLTLRNTDGTNAAAPAMAFTRDSSSPADNDLIGKIMFKGDNVAGHEKVYAEISSRINDTSYATEDGELSLKILSSGSLIECVELKSTSGGSRTLNILNSTNLHGYGSIVSQSSTIGTGGTGNVFSSYGNLQALYGSVITRQASIARNYATHTDNYSTGLSSNSAHTKTVNIGTGYATTGATTNINIGPTSATTNRTINLNGNATLDGNLTLAANKYINTPNLTVSKSGTSTDNYSTGVNTSSNQTKTVNIGTGFTSTTGSTNINLGPTATAAPCTINANGDVVADTLQTNLLKSSQFSTTSFLDFNNSSYQGGAATVLSSQAGLSLLFDADNNDTTGFEIHGDGSGTPLFTVDSNGNTATTGTLATGGFTLPATDGANGQILTTNGSGAVSWADGPTNTASLSGAAFTGDVTVDTNAVVLSDLDNVGGKGRVGIGVANPASTLDMYAENGPSIAFASLVGKTNRITFSELTNNVTPVKIEAVTNDQYYGSNQTGGALRLVAQKDDGPSSTVENFFELRPEYTFSTKTICSLGHTQYGINVASIVGDEKGYFFASSQSDGKAGLAVSLDVVTALNGTEYKDGTLVSAITSNGSVATMKGSIRADGEGSVALYNEVTNRGIKFTGTRFEPCTIGTVSNGGSGTINRPLGGTFSSYISLGAAGNRFNYLYLVNNVNVSSDRRLKENIADADDAGSTIDAIQVRKFDWIEDGRHQSYGMIAQELAEVYPEAVSVPENEEDTLGIATGDLIPMLIKEVQSLRSRVAELENK